MAYSDYRLCDKCGCKAFYDSNLNYQHSTKNEPIPDSDLIRNSFYKLDDLGDWCVLCRECSKEHECVIVPKGEKK